MIPFKERLAQGRPLIGLWQALANNYTADICARLGFDWLLFDGEHSPNTAQTLLGQLQAVERHGPEPIARVPGNDPVIIKQYLDIGFRTLLVPMVDTAEQAAAAAAATRYPPDGIRGVASGTSRAAGFGLDPGYLNRAAEGLTVIVQIESREALANAGAIAATPGVDAVFVGPGDLAASMDHLGDAGHAQVQAAARQALEAIRAAGKPAGIFALSPDHARLCCTEGYAFVAAGTDIGLLVKGGKALIDAVREEQP
ncbi:HpcH/HpaI aldolase/citrate lyase family protein [Sphingomonadales bacterium 56]|uniref:HpcH/HpaI aldolase family protein n=1 Tax=unclassified Sphingobium TaxID=2611147 RepID=UPI0019189C50|nr:MULTISPECIES: HpcH/HpaI aldolase/citrate lyase family protein [unclassified Sphingobium]MBY2929813.1 HpcH/HpaI aldolase/citrate lyase family protein [Sphingomonadales bacterium 56]MBY2960004.1 HpcH/HpaI aldolase/citrate lyase family protein [Sphingomonadales bacterium 58]CAD7340157.1 4-hydroxy-2-oxo-heptane-1,7-dioate aldolase [Sphingobium sp. S6]CAD7340267.1 4-hydroxy-2-oxo-heptane-1,7-dioate aldolase [Sphingobium sp. S8]